MDETWPFLTKLRRTQKVSKSGLKSGPKHRPKLGRGGAFTHLGAFSSTRDQNWCAELTEQVSVSNTVVPIFETDSIKYPQNRHKLRNFGATYSPRFSAFWTCFTESVSQNGTTGLETDTSSVISAHQFWSLVEENAPKSVKVPRLRNFGRCLGPLFPPLFVSFCVRRNFVKNGHVLSIFE